MELTVASIVWRLLGLLTLVFANGFFVAAEFAIVTIRKTRIDQLIAEGHRGALGVRRAITEPDHYIAATQLGVTMASLSLGWIGEPALANILWPLFGSLPAPVAVATAHSVAVGVAFAIITAVTIVLGELVPKWMALERPEAIALWFVRPLELFMRTFWPFIRLLHGSAQAIVSTLGLHRMDRRAGVHSEEELKMLVTASQEAGVLEEAEEQMLHRVFGFADLAAGQVMVPRTELIAIDADAPADRVIDCLAGGGHTRLPVYRGDVDNIVGILHVTDVVRTLAAHAPMHAGTLAREALTVPETLRADDLLAAMRHRGAREALVIDEYGGTAGLVTFEGLMERIVGDLGAFGTGSARVTVLGDGSAEIDGLALVADLNAQFDLRIDEATFTTVGGYVLGRLGRRARVGDTITVERRRMRVDALDGLRVARVWLSREEPGGSMS